MSSGTELGVAGVSFQITGTTNAFGSGMHRIVVAGRLAGRRVPVNSGMGRVRDMNGRRLDQMD
jgi:hypothetical protein